MSETDDTDDLLLIPPDFFVVQSEPEPPYYSIVDSLIKQVSSLQDRIEGIESLSDASLISSYRESFVESTQNTEMYKTKARRYYSHDDLYQPGSNQNTPQKNDERTRLHSLPNTPSVKKSPGKGFVRFGSPQKRLSSSLFKEPELIQEIDTFLSNVKTLQRNHAVRNLQPAFEKIVSNDNKKNQHCDKEAKEVQEIIDRVNAWRCGDDMNSIPSRGAGVREPKDPPEKLSKNQSDLDSILDKTDSSSESTQMTALRIKHLETGQINDSGDFTRDKFGKHGLMEGHDSALEALNIHKKLLENSKSIKRRGINTLSDTIPLPNLADMWASQLSQSPSKLSIKIQEEKLRRQHCEQLIQELQNKNLELQQKMAVALTVDETKNKTIARFKEALDEVEEKVEKLSEEKREWEREMVRMRSQFEVEIESANQKVSYYEKEASKSLSLAHANQEKMSSLEQRCSDLQKDLDQIERKFREVQDNYVKEYEKNKRLTEILGQKEIELKENKVLLNDARVDVAECKKSVEMYQIDFTQMKNDKTLLEEALKQEKLLSMEWREHKKKLINELQTYKTNEKTLKDALDSAKAKLENTKLELRNYYQGQLEIIVENKRKEMQNQLDQERQNGLEDMRKKELSMAKTAANHIKEISDKCALETKLLEQKHQEEIRLYQMQLSQAHKENEHLQHKLSQLPEKRAQIAKQLQKAMESQWNEALKLMNGSPTPVCEEKLNFAHQFPSKLESEKVDCGSDYDETPVSSRGQKQDSEIQKYINMLLHRPPGNPIGEQGSSQQKSNWNPGDLENPNKYDLMKPSFKDRKPGKPPWK